MSINTVVDEVEQMNETLWYDICVRFRKCFIEKLINLPVGQPVPRINIHEGKRLEYLQSLCALYPTEEIWPRYRSLRVNQVLSCLKASAAGPSSPENDPTCWQDGSSNNFANSVARFETGVQKLIIMIREDFELLNSGVLLKVISTFDGIQEIYLDNLSEEISSLVDALQEEMSSHQERVSSTGLASRDMPKSSSEFVQLGHAKNTLRKQHSKSLDSLLSNNQDEFTDIQVSFCYMYIYNALDYYYRYNCIAISC